jgi:hypothetical protein
MSFTLRLQIPTDADPACRSRELMVHIGVLMIKSTCSDTTPEPYRSLNTLSIHCLSIFFCFSPLSICCPCVILPMSVRCPSIVCLLTFRSSSSAPLFIIRCPSIAPFPEIENHDSYLFARGYNQVTSNLKGSEKPFIIFQISCVKNIEYQ